MRRRRDLFRSPLLRPEIRDLRLQLDRHLRRIDPIGDPERLQDQSLGGRELPRDQRARCLKHRALPARVRGRKLARDSLTRPRGALDPREISELEGTADAALVARNREVEVVRRARVVGDLGVQRDPGLGIRWTPLHECAVFERLGEGPRIALLARRRQCLARELLIWTSSDLPDRGWSPSAWYGDPRPK